MTRSTFKLYLMHLREFIRDPEIILWSVILPIAMSWVLGIAFVENKATGRRIAIVGDKSKNAVFNQLVNELENRNLSRPIKENDKKFFKFINATQNEAENLLKRGKISLYVRLERDSALTFFLDMDNNDSYLTYLILLKKLSTDNVPSIIKPVQSKGSRYIDFLIPGLIALGILNSCLWGIGYQMIEYRMKKLMRRLIATPLTRMELLLSFFYSRLTINLVEGAMLFAFGWYYFNVQIQGSWLSLLSVYFSGNVAFAGLAFLLASRAANTRTGNGIINVVSLPMTLAGGVFFSINHFPGPVQTLLSYSPLALLAESLRGVFNYSASPAELLLPIIALNLFGILCFAISVKIFKWV